jgi:ABC-type nitrate/sulfonate/bicarbonate transport system substrate-binding protein
MAASGLSRDVQASPHLIVSVPSLSISRLPYVIAKDQELYKKYDLDVELWTASPQSENVAEVHAGLLTRLSRALGINTPTKPDVEANGASPMMLKAIENGNVHHQVAIAATDCVVRAHIIGRKGITELNQLKGKRIGVASRIATSGFHALVLAQRMGWDSAHDITIVEHAEDVKRLTDGSLDAIVGYEREYATARREGLPILSDSREWNDFVAGNSALVDAEWLKDPSHREVAERFLKATIEAIAIFKQHREVAFHVMDTWYGIHDAEFAKTIYERGAWIPQKPYPCYEGFRRTVEVYGAAAMRQHKIDEFYDDSLLREIDASGFIDKLYK